MPMTPDGSVSHSVPRVSVAVAPGGVPSPPTPAVGSINSETGYPVVMPLCVFAAGRLQLDVIVRTFDDDPDIAFELICDALPLWENGWGEAERISVNKTGYSPDGLPIFHCERG